MTQPKAFPLGDILTITTDTFVAQHVGAIYELLSFMTGEIVMTHQIPRLSGECAPCLLEQHPDLADVRTPPEWEQSDVTREDVDAWLAEQITRYGETRDVTPLAPEDHTHIDPLTEMEAMKPGGVIPVVLAPSASKEDR